MEIKWFGQSCFMLTTGNRTKIVIDPFNASWLVRYKLPDVTADIVITSHNHGDHNNVKCIKGNYVHINKPGKYSVKGIDITGILTSHGFPRGKNVIFKFTIDGLNICHCGDLGRMLTEEQVAELGNVDVLMIPVGGSATINAEKASKVAGLLKAKVVIPMHYRTDKFKPPMMAGVDKFIEVMGNCKKPGKQSVEITRDNIGEYAGALVLDYE
jgi:L-ascorbate metabolism protein UlaG (beta-lactamase superfamily)